MTETRINPPESDTDKIISGINDTSYTIMHTSATTQIVLCVIAALLLFIAIQYGVGNCKTNTLLTKIIKTNEQIDQKAHLFTVNHKPGE